MRIKLSNGFAEYPVKVWRRTRRFSCPAVICSALLPMLICALSPGLARAGADVLFGVSGGGGHVPSDDWRFAATGLAASRMVEKSYLTESLSPFVEASLALVFRKPYAVRLSVEHIATEADVSNTFLVNDPPSEATSLVHWNFSTIPINLSFETCLLGYDHFSPVIGLGGGYYFSSVKWRRWLENPIVERRTSDDTRDGEGFGMHVYFGFRAIVWQRFGLSSKIRFRYADTMAFSDQDAESSFDFTGFDVTFGMDVRL